MWLLVIVGALVDQLILYAGNTVWINLPFTFLIAAVVAVWIICNELISILENIKDIGVKLPPFLQPLVTSVQKQVEEKTKLGDGNG